MARRKNIMKKLFSGKKKFWFKSSFVILLSIFLFTTIYVTTRFGFWGSIDNVLRYAQGGSLLGLFIVIGSYIIKK